MSGHNKWSSIKHKKGAADAKRGKIFARLGKEITLAAKSGGGDISLNPRLRSAVSAAKAANMPNDNVDRAIKKGTGELGGGALEELNYEGYAPGGVAIIVNCLSDNRNRTAANVRSYFSKNNSSLASSGSVSWMFHRKSSFTIEGPKADEETLLDILLEANADVEAIEVNDGVAEIIGAPDAFAEIANALEAAGIQSKESGLIMVPENNTEVGDAGVARQILRLIETLEDDDDVQEVFANFDIPDEVMEKLAGE